MFSKLNHTKTNQLGCDCLNLLLPVGEKGPPLEEFNPCLVIDMWFSDEVNHLTAVDPYMPSHPHFCTFTHIENLHPLSPAFCLNHQQSPVFCLMETKLPRQIFLQKEKRKIGHRSI